MSVTGKDYVSKNRSPAIDDRSLKRERRESALAEILITNANIPKVILKKIQNK